VASPSDENKNYLAIVKGQSILKKDKKESKSTYKLRHTIYSNYVPLE